MKYVTEPDPSASCCSILDQNLRNHWENFVRTAARHGLRPDPPHETVDLRLSDAGHVVVFGIRGPGGRARLKLNDRELELTNFLGLVLGCIEAKFCK